MGWCGKKVRYVLARINCRDFWGKGNILSLSRRESEQGGPVIVHFPGTWRNPILSPLFNEESWPTGLRIFVLAFLVAVPVFDRQASRYEAEMIPLCQPSLDIG